MVVLTVVPMVARTAAPMVAPAPVPERHEADQPH